MPFKKFTVFSLQFAVKKFKKTVHYSLSTINSQQGAIPLLLLIASFGIIAFITYTSYIPFKDSFLENIFRKPKSDASEPAQTGQLDWSNQKYEINMANNSWSVQQGNNTKGVPYDAIVTHISASITGISDLQIGPGKPDSPAFDICFNVHRTDVDTTHTDPIGGFTEVLCWNVHRHGSAENWNMELDLSSTPLFIPKGTESICTSGGGPVTTPEKITFNCKVSYQEYKTGDKRFRSVRFPYSDQSYGASLQIPTVYYIAQPNFPLKVRAANFYLPPDTKTCLKWVEQGGRIKSEKCFDGVSSASGNWEQPPLMNLSWDLQSPDLLTASCGTTTAGHEGDDCAVNGLVQIPDNLIPNLDNIFTDYDIVPQNIVDDYCTNNAKVGGTWWCNGSDCSESTKIQNCKQYLFPKAACLNNNSCYSPVTPSLKFVWNDIFKLLPGSTGTYGIYPDEQELDYDAVITRIKMDLTGLQPEDKTVYDLCFGFYRKKPPLYPGMYGGYSEVFCHMLSNHAYGEDWHVDWDISETPLFFPKNSIVNCGSVTGMLPERVKFNCELEYKKYEGGPRYRVIRIPYIDRPVELNGELPVILYGPSQVFPFHIGGVGLFASFGADGTAGTADLCLNWIIQGGAIKNQYCFPKAVINPTTNYGSGFFTKLDWDIKEPDLLTATCKFSRPNAGCAFYVFVEIPPNLKVSSDNSFADYDNVPHNYFDPFCDSYVDKYPHPYFCSPGTMPCDKQTKINNCQAFFPRAACLADNSCLITPSPTSLPSPTNSASTSPSPTPSPTTGTKRGDFNNDGKINVLDLSTLLTQWGRTGTNSADLNQDGKVNVLDLSVLLTQFGK